MCLAVPMKLVEIHADGEGVAELEGSRHAVNLSLVSGVRLGDYVIIHAGYAIEKLDQAEADATLALFAEIAHAVQAESRSREP
mgnify:CR=1 FL=1